MTKNIEYQHPILVKISSSPFINLHNIKSCRSIGIINSSVISFKSVSSSSILLKPVSSSSMLLKPSVSSSYFALDYWFLNMLIVCIN